MVRDENKIKRLEFIKWLLNNTHELKSMIFTDESTYQIAYVMTWVDRADYPGVHPSFYNAHARVCLFACECVGAPCKRRRWRSVTGGSSLTRRLHGGYTELLDGVRRSLDGVTRSSPQKITRSLHGAHTLNDGVYTEPTRILALSP